MQRYNNLKGYLSIVSKPTEGEKGGYWDIEDQNKEDRGWRTYGSKKDAGNGFKYVSNDSKYKGTKYSN